MRRVYYRPTCKPYICRQNNCNNYQNGNKTLDPLCFELFLWTETMKLLLIMSASTMTLLVTPSATDISNHVVTVGMCIIINKLIKYCIYWCMKGFKRTVQNIFWQPSLPITLRHRVKKWLSRFSFSRNIGLSEPYHQSNLPWYLLVFTTGHANRYRSNTAKTGCKIWK